MRGVDYYPEQWPLELMDDDLDRIVELGADTIRIGEFAWHLMEPAHGAYDFSFFDDVIARARSRGLDVVFGTPTATPPAWLATECDIASRFADGTARSFGGRHTACPNQPDYRQACEDVVRRLAAHYRHEAGIVAWQLDNEFGHEGADDCFCDACAVAFRAWLRERFGGDIERLNDTWGTVFWSQQYNDFDEVPLPRATITTHNPALRLDWLRFRSDTLSRFAADQARWVREERPGAVIMHDFPGGGLAKHVDYADVAKSLDVIGYNNYPVWGGQKEPLPPAEIAFGLDHMRGLNRGTPLWITEAIMGAQGHDVTGFLPRPGQAALWSVQALARGATGLCYFRYRQATKGAEQFCYGIIDADNRVGRRYREVRDVFEFARGIEPVLEAPVDAPVAILADYRSRACWEIQQQSILMDVPAEMARWHGLFHARNIMVDIVAAGEDFSGYRLLVVPHMILTDPTVADRLGDFVSAGGTVLVMFRSFAKDEDNNLAFGATLPLLTQEWLGVEVAETESVQSLDEFCLDRCADSWSGPAQARGGVFRDMLTAGKGTEVLYRYRDEFFPDYAALTRRNTGKGRAYYLGCLPDRDLQEAVVDALVADAGIAHVETPEDVEYVRRGEKAFVLNHRSSAVTCDLPGHGAIELAPFGYEIIEAVDAD
ncbi:beta-galactosidase [Nanchangia anserum]|uniref:Beta-galactosidase n=1 Tax=Nanchangia anserum TaxID=2692125 RepID=A0A8I0KPY9_9ACTO|nr:beta-galactosidase [Nanchangia anserum]MBD3689405.1 beta-galactosidase [Nanchangia anserum]QOX81612.1 beta-galactosidase [Nanchangia anserum]